MYGTYSATDADFALRVIIGIFVMIFVLAAWDLLVRQRKQQWQDYGDTDEGDDTDDGMALTEGNIKWIMALAAKWGDAKCAFSEIADSTGGNLANLDVKHALVKMREARAEFDGFLAALSDDARNYPLTPEEVTTIQSLAMAWIAWRIKTQAADQKPWLFRAERSEGDLRRYLQDLAACQDKKLSSPIIG